MQSNEISECVAWSLVDYLEAVFSKNCMTCTAAWKNLELVLSERHEFGFIIIAAAIDMSVTVFCQQLL